MVIKMVTVIVGTSCFLDVLKTCVKRFGDLSGIAKIEKGLLTWRAM